MTSNYSTARPLPLRLRVDLFVQLTQLEESGLPFDRALAILDLPPQTKPRLEAMRQLVVKGADLSTAGEKSGVFTKIEARLIRAASNAGSPARMYRRLADLYTARSKQAASMRSGMTLPAIMLVLSLLIQPLPKLIGGSLGGLGYLWSVVSPLLLIGGVFVVVRWFVGGDDRSNGKSPWQYVPLYGPIFVRSNLRDFFESLALMLEAGISLLDALPAALETGEDGEIRRDLTGVRRRVEKGVPFAEALRETACIKDTRVIEFAQTGEASGNLPEMLLRYVQMETSEIERFWQQVAAWVPRVCYALVALWIAYGLLTGSGVGPQAAENL
jgi:type II secretory pathway component PulF